MSKKTLTHALAYSNITLSTSVLVLLALYVYLVVTISISGALHQGSAKSVESVRSTLASLEETYLNLSGQLDIKHATELGLVEKNETVAYIMTGKTESVSLISP